MDIHYTDFYTENTELSGLNIYNAKAEFEKVFERLEDIESKEILCESLRCRLYDDNYRLPSEPSSNKYWGKAFLNIWRRNHCFAWGRHGVIRYFIIPISIISFNIYIVLNLNAVMNLKEIYSCCQPE